MKVVSVRIFFALVSSKDLIFFRDKHPDHHVAVSELKNSDKFVAYIFKVCKEKLTSVDKILTSNGSNGVEGEFY